MHIVATLNGAELDPMRFEKIGADIILIIYKAIPDQVVIRQPSQALAFGVEDGDTDATYDIYLRSIGYGSYTSTGAEIEVGGNPVPVIFPATDTGLFRAGNNNVLDVIGVKAQLEEGLQKLNALAQGGALTPANFALQLVKTPEEALFKPIQTNKIS